MPIEQRDIAERIAAFIIENDLAQVDGGTVDRRKRCWSVGFSRNKYLDGEVNVYGPFFIQVTYDTHYPILPAHDSRVFTSAFDALDFLQSAFVDMNFITALGIRTQKK